MKLYCTPGGTWAGSEKDYKAALKTEGVDAKTVTRRQVDVPVDKAGLMEFLTFHRVNPINPQVSQVVGGASTPSTPAAPPAAPAPETEATPPSPPAAQGDFQAQVDNLPLPYAAFIAGRIIDRIKGHLRPAE